MQKTGKFLSEGRTSMYKNFQVGKVCYHLKAIGNNPPAILVLVIEYCGVRWSTYHLWINVNERFVIKSEDVNKWVLVGFYLKSFRDSNTSNQYTTSLKMRHYQVLNQEDTQTITIGDNDLVKESDMIEVPTSAIEVAREIYWKTTFSPEEISDGITENSFLLPNNVL